jgi:hypothetical protein
MISPEGFAVVHHIPGHKDMVPTNDSADIFAMIEKCSCDRVKFLESRSWVVEPHLSHSSVFFYP